LKKVVRELEELGYVVIRREKRNDKRQYRG